MVVIGFACMACTCGCGNSYDFRPIGHWICHRCHAINDAGPYGSQKRTGVMDPEEVDSMVLEGIEFAEHAEASVRVHPDSWQAWYSLGATYAARGNLMEAGLVWARAGALTDSDDVLRALVERCSDRMAGCLSTVVKGGGKTNSPYMYGLEHACIHRLNDSISFCRRTYEGVCREMEGMPPREAFGLRNMASLILLQRAMILPDIRDHVPVLKTVVDDAESFRSTSSGGFNPIKRMISRKSSEYDLQEVVRVHGPVVCAVPSRPGEGRGGGRRSRFRGARPSCVPAEGRRYGRVLGDVVESREQGRRDRLHACADASEISAKTSEMEADIDAYVSMYMSGDALTDSDDPVYTG